MTSFSGFPARSSHRTVCMMLAAIAALMLLTAMLFPSGIMAVSADSCNSSTTPTDPEPTPTNPEPAPMDSEPVPHDNYYNPNYEYATGDTFFLGEYEQDNKLSSNEGELIEWRVLSVEEDRVLAISDKILDAGQYDANDAQGTEWAGSDLRRWLNDDFYNEAFSAEDKKLVIMCSNPGYKNPEFPEISNSETTDLVFCLSIYEVEKYLVNSYVTLLAEPTAYARAKIVSADCSTVEPASVITDPDARRPWWLRTNGRSYWLASIIHEDDRISYRGRVVTAEDVGIRPAIYLEHN